VIGAAIMVGRIAARGIEDKPDDKRRAAKAGRKAAPARAVSQSEGR
jgi:hypothetical protein